MKILIFLILTAIYSIDAHVRLTWPPARQYALDFLDNVRTEGPCGGTEQGIGPITTFLKGDVINVTWHLAYAHTGGYKIELLKNEVVDQSLTGEEYLGVNDTTAQQADIFLPADLECETNCTLRLLRQAAEWSSGTEEGYLFWSCADIRIIDGSTCNSNEALSLETCSSEDVCSGSDCNCYAVDDTTGCQANGGDCTSDICDCNAMFYGEYCQYKDECESDEDCGEWGICIDIDATSYPKKQCYCNDGYYGPECGQANPSALTTDIDAIRNDASYYERVFVEDPEFTLYWKMVNDDTEVEFVLHAESTTWLALGFRNAGTDSTCQEFPTGSYADTDSESESESETETETETESESESFRRRRRKRSAVVRVPRAESEETADSSDGSAYDCSATSDSEAEAESEDEAEAESEEEAEAEAEAESESESESESTGSLHAMDCVDMIIGSVRDGTWKIEDYYTRDRSTPRTDAWYAGGTNSLTAAAGSEKDGYTTLAFRRARLASEMQDVSIMNENMHIIWARGQEYNEYYHSPASGIESCTATDYNFYRQDELKYHGTSSSQRGAASMNLLATQEDTEGYCMGSYETEGYRASWAYDEESDEITFEIVSDQGGDANEPKWLAIGISDDTSMINTDVMAAWIGTDGNTIVSDRWASAKAEPAIDETQDTYLISGARVNGETTVVFKRKRITGDSQDIAFSDNNCYYMFFATNGGTVSGTTMNYHSETPVVSSERMCIQACVSSGTANLPTAFAFAITVILALINLL